MNSWTYHGVEGEKRVAAVIWKIMQHHYPGAINPQNPSLMAERLFRIARDMYSDIEIRVDQEHADLFKQKNDRIAELEAEIRRLRGLPPLPPVAIA